MHRGASVGFILFSFVLFAQEREAAPLKVEVLEGDGAINSIRQKRAHEPAVRVLAANGEPITNANVTFLLPASGASGNFGDWGLSYTTPTDAQGKAVGHGLRPNSIAGQFLIRVTASWHGEQGSATLTQTNAEPVVKTSHNKLIVILVAVGGAAALGAALGTHSGSSNPASSTGTTVSSPPPSGSITPGSPSFGPPH